MTREEAITELELFKKSALVWNEVHLSEAVDMAIEALHREEAEEKGYCHRIRPKNVEIVVRCKDCRHRCKEPIYSNADVHWVIYQIGDCPIICKTVSDDDYCSYGERREKNDYIPQD